MRLQGGWSRLDPPASTNGGEPDVRKLSKDPDERQRRTLWTVLLLNVAIAFGFFATGALGDSSALIANGLDNTSDSFVYAISLFALSRSDKWKRWAANLSGACC